MITIVFRSRLRPGVEEAYGDLLSEIEPLGMKTPGFVSKKTFVAEDGERLSLIEWQDAASLDSWRENPDHVRAKRMGREQFYSDYSLQIFETSSR